MNWIEEIKAYPLLYIIFAIILTGIVLAGYKFGDYVAKEMKTEPIESTRTVVWSCTVKSNIEGVITLNDDCKLTVIGEE